MQGVLFLLREDISIGTGTGTFDGDCCGESSDFSGTMKELQILKQVVLFELAHHNELCQPWSNHQWKCVCWCTLYCLRLTQLSISNRIDISVQICKATLQGLSCNPQWYQPMYWRISAARNCNTVMLMQVTKHNNAYIHDLGLPKMQDILVATNLITIQGSGGN